MSSLSEISRAFRALSSYFEPGTKGEVSFRDLRGTVLREQFYRDYHSIRESFIPEYLKTVSNHLESKLKGKEKDLEVYKDYWTEKQVGREKKAITETRSAIKKMNDYIAKTFPQARSPSSPLNCSSSPSFSPPPNFPPNFSSSSSSSSPVKTLPLSMPPMRGTVQTLAISPSTAIYLGEIPGPDENEHNPFQGVMYKVTRGRQAHRESVEIARLTGNALLIVGQFAVTKNSTEGLDTQRTAYAVINSRDNALPFVKIYGPCFLTIIGGKENDPDPNNKLPRSIISWKHPVDLDELFKSINGEAFPVRLSFPQYTPYLKRIPEGSIVHLIPNPNRIGELICWVPDQRPEDLRLPQNSAFSEQKANTEIEILKNRLTQHT